jgi:hydrogenase maturation protease
MANPRTLVVGLGNPLLGDDGIGWRVAEQVQREIEAEALPVEVDCLSVGGLRLMERLVGYDRVVLIDAISTGRRPPGSIYRLSLADLPDPAGGHLGSAHDTTLQTALELGRALGAPTPDNMTIVAVECECLFDFTEDLTPPVAAAVPLAARMVLGILEE